ncbi:MAG TPA: hypothetical protein VGB68_11130 [Pyrinomonadaceae bacterium]|jgi:hypothetical protein
MKYLGIILAIFSTSLAASAFQIEKRSPRMTNQQNKIFDEAEPRRLLAAQPDYTASVSCLRYEKTFGHGYGESLKAAKKSGFYRLEAKTYIDYLSPDAPPVRYSFKTKKFEVFSGDAENHLWFTKIESPALLVQDETLKFEIVGRESVDFQTNGKTKKRELIKIKVTGETAVGGDWDKAEAFLYVAPDLKNLVVKTELFFPKAGRSCALADVSFIVPQELFKPFNEYRRRQAAKNSSFAASDAQSEKLEAVVISKAKSTLVSRIEPGLPRQPFAVWFQSLVGQKTPVAWSVNDCGEQTGTAEDGGRDFPMCVEAAAEQSAGFFVFVNIQYGTFKRGITAGKPVIRNIFSGDELQQGGASAESLKELRRTLMQRAIDAEIFDPNDGVFLIPRENKPAGFEDFSEMYLQTKDYNRRNERVSVEPKGTVVIGQTDFAMREIVFDGKRWTFETVSSGGTSYKFDGRFSKIKINVNGAQDGENVLRGRLIKLAGGKETAQADLIFSFVLQGE